MTGKITHKTRRGRRAKADSLIPLTIAVDLELKRRLVEHAAKEGISISSLARQGLREYLDKYSGRS